VKSPALSIVSIHSITYLLHKTASSLSGAMMPSAISAPGEAALMRNSQHPASGLTALVSPFLLLAAISLHGQAPSKTRPGYYRFPAIHGDNIIFTAEGDLWTVSAEGGAARRLTSNTGTESHAAISPDGSTVAFTAEYEGPQEVYTMPVDGGLPQRRTWDGDAGVAGWTRDGKLLFRTRRYSTLPDFRLVALDADGNRDVLPLAQAASALSNGGFRR